MKTISKVAALISLLLLPLSVMAQPKKSFTLDDLMWGGSNYWNIMPRSVFTAWWGDALVQTNVDDARLLYDAKGRDAK